ncbi:MAG: 30S ribosomal protein S1 [Candidatus Cloacimonetes bacterium]|nr:30S ribosomal protein S1 [Candidatus Cloacimonadota bacterium]
MLTHDQNEVKTDLSEQELLEGIDKTSQTNEEEQVPTEEQGSEPTQEPIETQETTSQEETPEVEPELTEPQTITETPTMEETPAEPVVEEPPVSEPLPEKPEEPEAELSKEEQEHKEMLSMIDAYTASFESGEIKEGTVVGVTDKDVVVAIGYKSDGVIPISEFAYSGVPELNSVIKVYINRIENGEGKLELSKRKADFIHNIEKIRQAHEDGSPLPGVVRRRVKGGMIVEVLGIEAFLPGSQVSLKPIPNFDPFIGKELQFKVVSLDEDHRNIIVSRKAVLEDEAAVKRAELLERIQLDTELDGEVKNITQYGAFVDLGGIDGLLHITDMSWGKVKHPSEMLNIGDKLKVKVIGFDAENQKISLGLKQLVPHPWETIEVKFPEGTRITGKVVSVKSYGAFVEIEPGVEGLVHISEMSWTKKITDARKFVKVDDTVNAIVLELDKENKRISLGMKQMDHNPWLTIEDRYPIGTVLNRKIKSLTAFGAFVAIEEGIDGLIHISDISWTKRVYHPREVYRKGQEVEAVILSIDRVLHRIALGVKQLSPDPWENLNILLPVNTEVKGTISKLIPKGVLVDIQLENDVVEGFVPISHLAIPKLEHSEEAFFVGEELPLKVIELDMDNRRLILSVKAFFFSRDLKLQEEYLAIHEQYIRDRIAKNLKKKAEKQSREKRRQEKEQEALEAETEATQEMETQQEATPEEVPVVAEEAPTKEPVEEPVAEAPAEEAPVEEDSAPEPVEAEVTVEEEPAPEEVAEEAPVEEPTVEPEPVVEETKHQETAEPEEVTPEEAPAEETEPQETPAPEEVVPEETPEETPEPETNEQEEPQTE